MWADWASKPRAHYRACIVEALKTSGLPGLLESGATVSELIDAGFNARLLEPLLRILAWWGWARQGLFGRWYWTGGDGWLDRPGLGLDQGWHDLPKLLSRSALERTPGLVEQEMLADRSEKLVSWLTQELLPVRGQTWLDIGAGRGQFSRALQACGARPIMVDVVFGPDAPSSGIQCLQRNVFEEFPKGRYDGVALLRFVESFPEHQVRLLLDTCRQHLKPQGRLVLAGYFDEASEEGCMFSLHVALTQPRGRSYQVSDLSRIARSAQLVVSRTAREPVFGYCVMVLERQSVGEPPNRGGGETECPGAPQHNDEVRQARAVLP